MRNLTVLTIPALFLAACAAPDPVARAALPFAPEYGSVEARALAPDLVNMRVSMRGARDEQDVRQFARCAVAAYAQFHDFAFARHVRTTVQEEGGLWRGDAVYTISPDRPAGQSMIDVNVTVATCEANGIPTV